MLDGDMLIIHFLELIMHYFGDQLLPVPIMHYFFLINKLYVDLCMVNVLKSWCFFLSDTRTKKN